MSVPLGGGSLGSLELTELAALASPCAVKLRFYVSDNFM